MGHLSDAELFQPYFLVRAVEAILHQGGPWDESERIMPGAIDQLNDHVGYRPIATLETRSAARTVSPRTAHGPFPMYLREAGVAWGKYQTILCNTLCERSWNRRRSSASRCLFRSEPSSTNGRSIRVPTIIIIRSIAGRITSSASGIRITWTVKGHYRRFVARQITLDGACPPIPFRLATGITISGRFESSAVLAGIVLMSSCLGGRGPETHDSTASRFQ